MVMTILTMTENNTKFLTVILHFIVYYNEEYCKETLNN